MSKAVEPQAVMSFLNQLFGIFDELCDLHQVTKVRLERLVKVVNSQHRVSALSNRNSIVEYWAWHQCS